RVTARAAPGLLRFARNDGSLMAAYIARRVLLMIPTLFGIMLVAFVLIQFAPGGPVERILAQLQGQSVGATASFAGSASGDFAAGAAAASGGTYRGSQGLDPAFIKQLN